MSKRDELKKLRSAQKNTYTDDTPAEDYSKSAAEAEALQTNTKQEEEPKSIEEENVPSLIEPVIEPQKSEDVESFQEDDEAKDKTAEISAPIASYTITNLPGKRISVSLKIENKNWMHRTAMRCGLSIQDYVNILVEEAWDRDQKNPYVGSDDDPLPERIPSNQTVLVAIKLTNENIERSKRLRAAHYMTMTGYMNYLIEEEIKREKEFGMRRAVFDNDSI